MLIVFMKCQILFPEKNKKKKSKCRLLKILPRVLSVDRVSIVCDKCLKQNPKKLKCGHFCFAFIESSLNYQLKAM